MQEQILADWLQIFQNQRTARHNTTVFTFWIAFRNLQSFIHNQHQRIKFSLWFTAFYYKFRIWQTSFWPDDNPFAVNHSFTPKSSTVWEESQHEPSQTDVGTEPHTYVGRPACINGTWLDADKRCQRSSQLFSAASLVNNIKSNTSTRKRNFVSTQTLSGQEGRTRVFRSYKWPHTVYTPDLYWCTCILFTSPYRDFLPFVNYYQRLFKSF